MRLHERGRPIRQDVGAPDSQKPSTPIYTQLRSGASSSSILTRTRSRVRPGGLVVYGLVVASVLYLAAHTLAAIAGWRAAAFIAIAVLWALIVAWSWAAVALPGRRDP